MLIEQGIFLRDFRLSPRNK